MTEAAGTYIPHLRYQRVGFWRRVLATLLDAAFIFVIAFVCVIFVSALIDGAVADPESEERFVAAAIALICLLYSTMEIFTAGTLGKLILRMRIRNVDSTPADRWTLFLRWSSKQSPMIFSLLFAFTNFAGFRLVSGLCGTIVTIGCLFAANDDKLAWHDQWAKTAVYPIPKPVAQGFEVVTESQQAPMK
jgi:uncharacterized RDD family membrane protein YckC